MLKNLRSQCLLLAVVLLAAFTAGAQQARPKIPPPDFKREWTLDAAGLRQWKPFDVTCDHCKGTKGFECEHCKGNTFAICLECDGKKHTTCRVCAGKGKLPDPLVELACPYCAGSAWYPCELCNSFGVIQIDGVETKCSACKQKGLLKCIACNGTRRIEGARFGKKNVGEGSSKDLKELLVRLRASQAALEKFEPEANPSKSMKSFAAVFEPLERDLKVVKDMEKMLEEALKGVKSYGAGYTGYEEHLLHQFLVFKDRSVFLLQYQVLAAEQSLERAEFNDTK